MSGSDLTPEEVALRRDLQDLAFVTGQKRRKWALEALAFPYAYFRVQAPRREQGPAAFLLRVDATGYGRQAPTSVLWNGLEKAALSEPMKPKRRDGPTVIAFTDSCGQCLYHPIDRLARDHWAGQFEDLAWGPGSTITTLLECVHALLDSSEYHCSSAPDAAAYLSPPAVDRAA